MPNYILKDRAWVKTMPGSPLLRVAEILQERRGIREIVLKRHDPRFPGEVEYAWIGATVRAGFGHVRVLCQDDYIMALAENPTFLRLVQEGGDPDLGEEVLELVQDLLS